MASNRHTNSSLQGRPLKPALASNRTAKTPVPPRLAHVASGNGNGNSFPRLAATKVATPATGPCQSPALQPSLLEDSSTPVKNFLTDNITPRSSSRKSRADSTNTTPNVADGTPSNLRPKLLSPSQSEIGVQRRSFDDPRSQLHSNKAKSVVDRRDTVTSQPAPRSPAYLAAGQHAPPKITRDTSHLFFRADQAKSQPETQRRSALQKKTATFIYADGQEDTKKNLGPRSADSTLSSPHSPPLSAVSLRSPYFPVSVNTSPSCQPPSPPKESIHLSYRRGVSQIIGRTASPSPISILPDRSHIRLQNSQQHTPASGHHPSRVRHSRNSSLSSIDCGSPDQSNAFFSIHSQRTPAQPLVANIHENVAKPTTGANCPPPIVNTEAITLLPPLEENSHSGVKQGPDLAAEARRERKVLDLEISNSSLLAINKSLEREIRKQKAELKRFRRLSRAGQFDVKAIDNHAKEHLVTLDEEGEELPDFDSGTGRPSSPFQSEPAEDYSDDDDADSTSSSAHPLSPTAQADSDAKHRADDEERLRLDLSRHRELLLDTQRMNKSLQRCLTWTEDLIIHGKKALEYQVPADVKLGGRILTEDDEIDLGDADEATSLQGGSDLDDILNVDDLVTAAMSGYLDVRKGDESDSSKRHSGSEKDSGVGFGSVLPSTPLKSTHTVEFGKPTPMRNPLLVSRENPGNRYSGRMGA
ncbi:hypothetical protein BDV97DRAFT_398765 [Delphinella strobiligena]|nr:hypothetical protein BDV97DRAFT_398765 [Delphinella strobiligena]